MRRLRAQPVELQPRFHCNTDNELYSWIEQNLSLKIPRVAVCPHHQAPWDYIRHTYFEPAKDVIVWAPRGGGKTRLGALATLLDLLHKPGCSVRILGGSFEQSLKMWEHLLPDVMNVAPHLLGDSRALAERLKLTNGSSAAVLTQSQRAVRGLRVQKLRCDEVELFDPDIWQAAQLVTRSIESPGWVNGIRGTVEAISTLHKPYGLMNQIVEKARENGTKVIQWCLLDVLEKCPPERDCDTCPLLEDCGRRAKDQCDGFFRIEDAITMKRRVSIETWEAEMMCRRPNLTGCVFPSFDLDIHVRQTVNQRSDAQVSLGIDFGFHAPFVCLWIRDDGETVHVLEEYLQPSRSVAENMDQVESRPYGKIKRLCCDPAGASHSDQTAISNIQILKSRGYKVHSARSGILEGIEMIRAALRPASGQPTLFIHPGCKKLIEALRQCRYPDGGGELPLKDGVHDHPIDALRYFYVNRFRAPTTGRAY